MKLSIIIPVLDEAKTMGTLLNALQSFRERGHEVIVIDGGSGDNSVAIASPRCDLCQVTPAGRAIQMQAGADVANGDVLWFLHADSRVPAGADEMISQVLDHAGWGGFPVRLSGSQRLLRIVERLMNIRSRLTGILTGDQGIFIERQIFDQVGGFQAIPLMEDIDLSTRLKRVTRPAFAGGVLETSSRRWESHGTVRTIVRMWLLRLAFSVGVPAHYLANHYV
ncbi:rSAM/selenodomain-associated transferase 2 [Thiogranum longum]|uniref:RSAM/selenodomain-associated transferase 2 n=1 Tax=Thiogranum longum TaxID=1537524 RepID=A0A4R1HAF7_9GAMM|nr:TIGR04283 family arsenosugar biosynthesis glycosyltransferase [Thiogranum longum]TCK18328.1 rSAM/selenodomain-associated transferase 2 [Thiogranum longum]